MNNARIRLVCIALLFFASMLVILPAPNLFLWHVAILATEFGHWLVGLVLLILMLEWRAKAQPLKFYTLGLCLLAAFFFLWPTYQATRLAQPLPAELSAAFGPGSGSLRVPSAPLAAATLWSFPTTSEIQEISLYDEHHSAIEFYRDHQTSAEPCLVMIHGGGWNSGDEKQLSTFSRILAGSGCRVASVAYRLCPAFTWPAQKEDVLNALAYLKAHAQELGINPQQFILFGRSAGGQIALASAYAAHDSAIRGCIALYSPTDMVFAYQYGSDTDMLRSRALVRDFMGGSLENHAAAYKDASPLALADAQTPPTLLIHGTRDELVWVRHSRRLRDRLVALGRPVFFLELPWATHAYEVNANGPGGQLTVYAITRFINSVTSSSALAHGG